MSQPATGHNETDAMSTELFRGKDIVVGVTGGIAAYKSAMIVSRLVQSGAAVTVVMTDGATRFVTALTFEALSGRSVITSIWDQGQSHDPQHIKLADGADAMVIAPCTMDCLARLVQGRTDDAVTLIASAIDRSQTPVLLAPAMNSVMWSQASTQRNAVQLRDDGFAMVGPGDGWQACRHVGPGRMSEPGEILDALAGLIRVQREAGTDR